MNAYEAKARGRKATALATALELFAQQGAAVEPEGWVELLEQFSDGEWLLLADLAGVTPPSEQTKALTLDYVGRNAAVAHRDPFAGLPR